jgi:hypothetical protein
MNPMMIVTLVETVFSLLANVVKSLVDAGVIPVDHPAVAQTAQAKLAVIDAKTTAAIQP